MQRRYTAVRWLSVLLLMVLLSAATVSPARAQGSADPNPGALTLTGGFDFANAYFFRGIFQDDTGVVMWPYADLGFALHSGDGLLKSVTVNIGTWNSLHTGDTGSNGPSGKLWYESDFYTGASVGFGSTTVGVAYTAYTSPNQAFGTVKELSFKVGVDDSGLLGKWSVKPYALLAQELDGQADGGANEGTYLELGIGPGRSLSKFAVTVPVKVGLSLNDYYEGISGDETFGFLSVAGVVTVPFTSAPGRFGSWNIHGGVEFLMLGDRNEAVFGDSSHVIGSVGIGLSY
jgi:hypothetical protein